MAHVARDVRCRLAGSYVRSTCRVRHLCGKGVLADSGSVPLTIARETLTSSADRAPD